MAIRRIGPLGHPFPTQSPFLFAVYHLDHYPAGKPDMSIGASTKGRRIGMDFGNKDWNMYHGKTVPGFPVHPHRGFETVTVCRKGMVDHSDAMGCAGRFGDGDTQWMTAGTGVSHCEMFPQLNTDKPNPLDLFQIWLNLPAKSKHVAPHFKMLWAENNVDYVFSTESTGAATYVTTIAGTLPADKADTQERREPTRPPPDSWAANPDNHVAIWAIRLEPGAEWKLPASPEGTNRSVFFFKGPSVSFGGSVLKEHASIECNAGVDAVLKHPGKAGSGDVELLLLQGRPIDEPVVKHGPFVMNTAQEIQEAFMDYQMGKFGRWPWKSDDPVHPKDKGRFAKHGDGRVELPPAAKAGDKEESKEAAGAGVGAGAGEEL